MAYQTTYTGRANAVRAIRPNTRAAAFRPVEGLASHKAYAAELTVRMGRPTMPAFSQPGMMYSPIEAAICAGAKARRIDIGKAVISLITILLSRQLSRAIEINRVNVTRPMKNATEKTPMVMPAVCDTHRTRSNIAMATIPAAGTASRNAAMYLPIVAIRSNRICDR